MDHVQVYAELFCQSNFSFLQGASHPEELISTADNLGYSALAITDECSVAGVVRAFTEARDKGLKIKLIVGSLLKLNSELTLVLLCPDHNAYAELCRIITNARRRSPKGQYQLELWDLRSVRHCLVIWLPSGEENADHHWGKWLSSHYRQRLWIGCQRHLEADEHNFLHHCRELASTLNLPITACGGVLMHDPERLPLQHTLSAIKAGKAVADMGRHLLSNRERALRPLTKIAKLFDEQWLDESVQIAQRCTFELSELSYQYPKELVPEGKTASQHLRQLVLKGMAFRFPDGTPMRIKRIIVKELLLIDELGYWAFFLTIHDIVQFAKSQKILYQGRGSAANSTVCYCLEITAVDPSQIDVLFERFISKERQEPPDIDVDFEHQRREEVIQYVYNKYGRERTAIAATVITYRLKSAIRDVGKALGFNLTQLDFFIKNINHRDREDDWRHQISQLGLDANSRQGRFFLDLVTEIRGFPRHLSQHVGGFVISSGPLYELVPIENAAMADRSIIQWDKDDLESLGLLKVDVLALGMLTAIHKSFDLIQHHSGRALSIAEITAMGDDPDVYRMIQKADTVGVFQIESRAQMSMLPRLRPSTYYDLVIQIAIVRPGPIQGNMVHPFLKRRDGKESVLYPSATVKSVLKRTLGVPIFQEQVIKLAMVAAGFTGGEADKLRRAMATWKKNGELMRFKDKLVEGMRTRGYDRAFAEQLFEQIKGFGEYGFPESHSASFAVLAYVSSWLKYYYPSAFYVGLLNSWPMGFYPPAQLIKDARHHNVKVLPICINRSQYDHSIELVDQKQAIRLGFRLVKSLSSDAVHTLIQHRPKKGFERLQQVKRLGLKSTELEALSSANAFSAFSDNRYQARWELMNEESELPLLESQSQRPDFVPRQLSGIETVLEDYQSTRLSLYKHPIRLLRDEGLLSRHTTAAELIHKQHKQNVTVIGLVIGRQRPGTSKGVTFMTLEDDTGNINAIVWLATARAQKKSFLHSKIVRINGILERGDGGVTHIIAGKIDDLTHLLMELDNKARHFH